MRYWSRKACGVVTSSILLGSSLLFATRNAEATLVPQMARCSAPFDTPGFAITDPVTAGYGNDPSDRTLVVNFVYASGDSTKSVEDNIAETNRIEICWVGIGGSVNCPGWKQGGEAWTIFDRAGGVGSLPPEAKVKLSPTDAATKAQLQWKTGVPIDWDSAGNVGRILILVANATAEPTQLSAVSASVTDGGFCGVPYRLFAGRWDTTSKTGVAAPSDTGSKTDASVQHVLYGLRDGVALPVGWTFGSVCDGHQNVAGLDMGDANVCLNPRASTFGLARLAEIDQWQYDVVQAGQAGPGHPLGAVAMHTWWNGIGTAGQATTCTAGATCPTRVFFAPNPHGSAGYGWGGVYAEAHGPYLDQIAPWEDAAEEILRNHAHEYFHGLGSTWFHATDYPVHGSLWGNAYISEPFATAAEPSACITRYPTDPAAGFNPSPEKCVSSRTLYGPYYIYGGLLAANTYLQFPENPLETYPGVLFYRYAAAQFAYKHDQPGQLAHLPSATTDSVSPVRYDPTNTVELPLNDRRPDEGMDLLGYILSTLPETNAPSLPCNTSLPPEASIVDRINCVFEHYVGRNFDDMLLEFHTMLVLKDYVDTDPRWRLEWLGDYNDGAASPIFNTAPAPIGIKSQKPFVKATSTGGQGFPDKPSTALPDQLFRVHRVQDTYTCAAFPCTGANRLLNTLAPGATLSSGADVAMGKWGSAYVSIHPDPGYGVLDVHVSVSQGSPRFRVYTINAAGVPTSSPLCTSGTVGSEMCAVTNDVMDVPVAVTADVDEVLLVASSGSEPSAFTWRLGPDAPRLRIVSPTTGSPASIGSIVSGSLSPRSFLLNFTATLENDEPFDGVSSGNLVIRVDGAPISQPGDCPGAGCPFTLMGSGGSYVAAVSIPAAMYPAGPDRLDLSIDITPLSTLQGDEQPESLIVTPSVQTAAVAFVFDVSGSMGDDGKMDAARKAAHLVADGLTDDDYAGVAIFSTHSQPVLLMHQLDSATNARGELSEVIDAIPVGGSTSIGNGLYRGQDLLAQAFDSGPVPPGLVTGMLALTDGKSNCEWTPLHYFYYNEPRDAPLTACTACECNSATVPRNPPWPDDGASPDYWNSPLGYSARKSAGKRLPIISTVGVGPEADMGSMSLLASSTGGAVYGIPNTTQFQTLTLTMADAFRTGVNAIAGYERVLSQRVELLLDLPSFTVDPDTAELLVSVLSLRESPGTLRLVTPLGDGVAPARTAEDRAVFRVPSPTAGTWTFDAGEFAVAPPTSDLLGERVFVEVAVRSPCTLVTHTDVPGGLSLHVRQMGRSAFDDDLRWAGRALKLEAVVDDHHAVSGASIAAQVVRPDGIAVEIRMFDDGRHGDGQAADGHYATMFRDTSRAGTYSVRYLGSLDPSIFGKVCARQRSDEVVLAPGLDLEADGLPDWWQVKYNLPPGTPVTDTDRDGLTDVMEFEVGTRPDRADTDGGGESDASELLTGRDPFDRADDAVGTPQLVAAPGNGKVLLQTGVPWVSGMAIEVDAAESPEGPFARDATILAAPGAVIELPASNDTQRCFVARVVTAAATSGWSSAVCATPREDPYPPKVALIRLEDGGACVHGPVARLRLDAADGTYDPRVGWEYGPFRDEAAEQSGISEMLVETSTSQPASNWQPYRPTIDVTMDATATSTVVVRLRDHAGNESVDYQIALKRCDGSGVERAIVIEEQALRAFVNGQCPVARSLIGKSLPELDQSIQAVAKRIRAPAYPGKKTDVRLLATLLAVRARKVAAAHAHCCVGGGTARRMIEDALQLEHEVIDLAAENRRPLF